MAILAGLARKARLAVLIVFEMLEGRLQPPIGGMAFDHHPPNLPGTFGLERLSDVVDPILGDVVARFYEDFSLERLFEVIGVFGDFPFERRAVFVLFEEVGDIGSEIEPGELVGHDFRFDFAFVPDVARDDLMMVADTDFREVVPHEHGRHLVGVGSFHFGEYVANLRGVERMFGNGIGVGDSAKTPPLVLDVLEVEGFEEEIGDSFEHGKCG